MGNNILRIWRSDLSVMVFISSEYAPSHPGSNPFLYKYMDKRLLGRPIVA